ncbi:hypothetical protein EMCG_06346 [[Emmonsia] crescens]|uniref:Uncharacterized protein n=1 Tax=[Emmonsia] crescens TaxID=73230 RepID=A0A0G2J6W9_9EURO|nr:hypothetical protein EMCG_06346 [Emmonsia crescens UAMH 3008]
MGDQQNISQILAALAAHQATSTTGHTSSPQQGQMPLHAYSGSYHPSAAPANIMNYSLPPPDNTGSLDISGAKPVNTGSVSIADAIAKARGIAAEKGIVHDPNRGMILASSRSRFTTRPTILPSFTISIKKPSTGYA